jgi:hypothetical protein
MATNRTPRLAFTVAALFLTAPVAHAEQYCTPRLGNDAETRAGRGGAARSVKAPARDIIFIR